MTTKENPLNPHQQSIVDHLHGAILVLAPVGTGKTRVLAKRVVHAVEMGIPARQILCLTFTNRAAVEMRERLFQHSPEAAREATIKTFHALCAHMLRVEARRIGIPADFVIYDDQDSLELIKTVFSVQKDQDARRIDGAIARCKVDTRQPPSLSCPVERLFASLGTQMAARAGEYQAVLRQRHALDFADLVYYARAMLRERDDIRQRWEDRFDFIQVDEAQDTHLAEYEIVRTLAAKSGNLALIGDMDQTIYTWRGSEPERVIGQFQHDFSPKAYSLVENYRATRMLLGAADSFANSFRLRHTSITPARTCPDGEPIRIYHASNEEEEASWIGQQIQMLARGDPSFRYNRVAVLTRTNRRGQTISGVFSDDFEDLPFVTVEQYEFFRRQEIKDALAYLRLLTNPYDTSAMQRVLLRPRRGIGRATIAKLMEQGDACGLRLTDMANSQTLLTGDPFGPLLGAFSQGAIVVFDVETTGLSVSEDEVVELAATRLEHGRPAGHFQVYIANTVPVGETERIHGHSDDFLAAHGRPAQAVLKEFFDFATGALLVGHNVGFDVKMITAHARKLGLCVPALHIADTWSLANRFVQANDYRLETLASTPGLKATPTHQASADVDATVELLCALIPVIRQGTTERRRLVRRYGGLFQPLASQFDGWLKAMASLRPAELLQTILRESGLSDFYQNEPRRMAHLERLGRIFHARDNPILHPETALRALLEFTSLARNVDYLSETDNQVVIVTIHQAKGLEFDIVFIAGASEGEIPSYYCNTPEQLDEERRLFYVAMTRAREKLYISGYQQSAWGHFKSASPFVHDIDRRFLHIVKDHRQAEEDQSLPF